MTINPRYIKADTHITTVSVFTWKAIAAIRFTRSFFWTVRAETTN